MTSTLDVSTIREAFPALRRHENGRVAAYFDGPGGTQVPGAVADAMVEYLLHHNANTHWEYATSRETDEIIFQSREKAAQFLNADSRGVAFGANMTTLTFHLARALVKTFPSGSWLVVTDLDHQANVAPWRYAAREQGLSVHTIRMTVDGQLNREDIDAFIRPGLALLAIGAASNALGTINNLEYLIWRTESAGGLTFLDAVHYAPHRLVDFAKLRCDFLVCSPYKFYGPHAGILAGRPELLEKLDVPRLDPAPNDTPERLETGTLSHEAIAGTAAAIDFLAQCSEGDSYRSRLETTFKELEGRGDALLEAMWSGLQSIPGVRLYGPRPSLPRTPTVAFTLEGVPSSEVASRLCERHGVYVSHGDFYASRVTAALGLGEEGLVRAGCACYTTSDEVERLIQGVEEIAGGD